MEIKEKLYKLEAEEELRLEVSINIETNLKLKINFESPPKVDCGKNDKVIVELKSGMAEIFGTELVINTKYVPY